MTYQCDDCGLKQSWTEADPVQDITQRFAPNGLYTDRQCHECGALAYPTTDPSSNRTKALEAYALYISHNLERIDQGGWVPVCFAEFIGSADMEAFI